MDKTVFILGAGASFSARIPVQAGILPLIFSIERSMLHSIEYSMDLLSARIDTDKKPLDDYYDLFDQYRRNIGHFIIKNFSSKEKYIQYKLALEQADNIEINDGKSIEERNHFLKSAYNIAKAVKVTLEDIFTIFDSVESGREHFRLYSFNEIMNLNNQLKLCIIYVISFSIIENSDNADYISFSRCLIKRRIEASQKDDVLSVITMNWDDILDKTLYSLCEEYNLKSSRIKIFPDFCFYNYSMNFDKKHIPSTHIKAKGNKNIKLLKMHGSLSWLECPKCMRIFTDYKKEIAIEEFGDVVCPYCRKEIEDTSAVPLLRNMIITPTFKKSLDNLNVKNIWHNAYIDLSEADHIVFIGYSFPEADFEMRCLLKKAIEKNVDITIVLSENDSPQTIMKNLKEKGFTEKEAHYYVSKMNLPEERYKSFFGEHALSFDYSGFNGYLKGLE